MSNSLDNVCKLIKKEYYQDKIGQFLAKESEREIFCKEKPIYNNEFFNAGQCGIKPSLNLVIDSEEYEGEKELVFEEVRYNIYRTFKREDSFTELYCEVVCGGKKEM